MNATKKVASRRFIGTLELVRYLPVEKVRTYCIKHDLYGCGTNQDYENMFNLCRDKKRYLSDSEILEISIDIVQHSADECTYIGIVQDTFIDLLRLLDYYYLEQ